MVLYKSVDKYAYLGVDSKKNIETMIIGIDSAHKMCFTGVVSGSESDIFQLYSDIEKVMRDEGINPPFHWSSIKSSRRKSVIAALTEKIKFSKINFTVLIHKDKSSIPRMELIHEIIPKVIAESLWKWVSTINGKVIFEVNSDFDVGKTKTKHFVHKTLSYLMSFLTTDELVKIRDKNGVFVSEFNQKHGKVLLVGYTSSSQNSKVIQIADLLLGCFIYDAKFDYERNFIKKLC